MLDGPAQRGAHVATLVLKHAHPSWQLGTSQLRFCPRYQSQEQLCMPLPRLHGLVMLLQLLQSVLADRFQHREARRAVRLSELTHKAMVNERCESIEHIDVRVAGFGGLKRPSASKVSQLAVEPLFLLVQQVVTPGDGVADRLLSGGKVTRSPGE